MENCLHQHSSECGRLVDEASAFRGEEEWVCEEVPLLVVGDINGPRRGYLGPSIVWFLVFPDLVGLG